ncbi:MAG: Nif3-like dinuclear metal center hexameric protein, partial [Phycisphaerales bacterium]|nr:Nif3-like dinuclear metal center hexameric protein [Phycisphaerales bacterium]
MTVQDLVDAVEAFAPPSFAESWDRVGLHVGRLGAPLDGPVMLAIDLTEGVLDEAIEAGAGAIVAYHPPIWTPIDRLTDDSAKGRILLRAVEAGIAIYSPHTALDAAPGGVTDWLCEGICGGTLQGDCRALVSHTGKARVKVVTFVPHEA